MGWLFLFLVFLSSAVAVRKINDPMMDSLSNNHEWALIFEYDTVNPAAQRKLQPTSVSLVVHTFSGFVEARLIYFPCRTCSWAVKGKKRINSRDDALSYQFFNDIVDGKRDLSLAFTIVPTVHGFDTSPFAFPTKVMRPQKGVLDESFYDMEAIQFKEIRLNMYFEKENATFTIFDWKKEMNREKLDPNFIISSPGIYLFQTKKGVSQMKPLFYNPLADMQIT